MPLAQYYYGKGPLLLLTAMLCYASSPKDHRNDTVGHVVLRKLAKIYTRKERKLARQKL
jgi:hypothetical protein